MNDYPYDHNFPFRYGPLFALVASGQDGVAKVDLRFPDEVSALMVAAEVAHGSHQYAHVVLHMGELHDGVGDITFWKDGDFTPEVKEVLAIFGNPDPTVAWMDFLTALATASILKGQWYEVHNEFTTTSLFWDCDCHDHHIRSFTEDECGECGKLREDGPDARIDEILKKQAGELSPALVAVIKADFSLTDKAVLK